VAGAIRVGRRVAVWKKIIVIIFYASKGLRALTPHNATARDVPADMLYIILL